MSGKRLMAFLAWQIATTGKATFPDGTVLEASPKDVMDTWKWLYAHIDGPPKASLELSGGLQVVVTERIVESSPEH